MASSLKKCSLCRLSSVQVSMVEEEVGGSDLFGSTCMLFDLLSDHILCFQTIYNFFILIFTFVILLFWFLLLFSTHNTYCISVHPGRGISPLLLFPGFLLLFFLLNVFWGVFLERGRYSNRGSNQG